MKSGLGPEKFHLHAGHSENGRRRHLCLIYLPPPPPPAPPPFEGRKPWQPSPSSEGLGGRRPKSGRGVVCPASSSPTKTQKQRETQLSLFSPPPPSLLPGEARLTRKKKKRGQRKRKRRVEEDEEVTSAREIPYTAKEEL